LSRGPLAASGLAVSYLILERLFGPPHNKAQWIAVTAAAAVVVLNLSWRVVMFQTFHVTTIDDAKKLLPPFLSSKVPDTDVLTSEEIAALEQADFADITSRRFSSSWSPLECSCFGLAHLGLIDTKSVGPATNGPTKCTVCPSMSLLKEKETARQSRRTERAMGSDRRIWYRSTEVGGESEQEAFQGARSWRIAVKLMSAKFCCSSRGNFLRGEHIRVGHLGAEEWRQQLLRIVGWSSRETFGTSQRARRDSKRPLPPPRGDGNPLRLVVRRTEQPLQDEVTDGQPGRANGPRDKLPSRVSRIIRLNEKARTGPT